MRMYCFIVIQILKKRLFLKSNMAAIFHMFMYMLYESRYTFAWICPGIFQIIPKNTFPGKVWKGMELSFQCNSWKCMEYFSWNVPHIGGTSWKEISWNLLELPGNIFPDVPGNIIPGRPWTCLEIIPHLFLETNWKSIPGIPWKFLEINFLERRGI